MAGAYPHLSFSKEEPLRLRRSRNGFGTKIKCANPEAHAKGLQKQLKSFQDKNEKQLGGDLSRNIIQIKLFEKMSFEDISKHGISIVGQQDDTVYLAFADEQQLNEFNSRLAQLVDGEYVSYPNLLYAIDKMDVWSIEDRKSWALKNIGFPPESNFVLDIELWPLGTEFFKLVVASS